MPIGELLAHEKGILNLIALDDEVDNIAPVSITQNDYESIFQDNPTFYEKKAFVDMFRKKWREDRGLCSIFEKR